MLALMPMRPTHHLFFLLLLLLALVLPSPSFAMSSPTCPIQIVEHCLRSKKGANLDDCEDAWIIAGNYACVLDGATSPTGRRWTSQQLTGGQWAAHVLREGVSELAKHQSVEAVPSLQSPEERIGFLTAKLRVAYENESPGCLNVMTKQPEERATASLVLYCHDTRQILMVGDCQCALLDHTGAIQTHIQPERYIDQVTARARAMFLQAERLGTPSSTTPIDRDLGREFIQPLLRRQRRFQNNLSAPAPYRYWAMDGWPIHHEEGIQVFDIPDGISEVILASDGYPTLLGTLKETEDHLKETLEKDPKMMGDAYVGTKGVPPGAESFDDRTYLRIRIR